MKYLKLMILLILAGFFYGCAQKEISKCTLPEHNPEHHYLIGMKALEDGNPELAQEKFERAIYCDENFSKAYSGLAIAKSEKVKRIQDPEIKKIEIERIKKDLKTAKNKAKTPQEEFDYYMAKIRILTNLKPNDWLEETEKAYFNAVDIKVDDSQLTYYQGKEATHYFMGIAYLEAFDFEKAKDKFKAVLNSKRDGKWHEKSDRAWKKADKITRAMAGITVGNAGKKIAVKDSITRADLAALLINELKIDRVFSGRIPAQSQIEKIKPEFVPADILNNPFKQEILTILKWKIRGLEPKYDETVKAYLFKPDEVVKRGEMALILEDVLIKITADEKIATAFFGHEKSPFPDVRTTSPIYNAVMNMTTRGIMEPELSGEFNPERAVDGAEAILAIRMLKQKLNTY
ncbi:S-layer homology domain-containing protein [Thermodesulfovibrio sp. 3907-1M]|uniref:S-layer homology domain-containing protein n=1 Tax=Thermodesulfovibrio autotrophicus TaxID=3118333 RepID=A0AAU8GX03_9BACT